MVLGKLLSFWQLSGDILPADTFFYHKHHHMVKEIRNLVFDLFFIRILGCDHNLCALFTDFFKNLVDTFIKKIIGVRTFFRMFFAVCDHVVDVLEYMKRIGEYETQKRTAYEVSVSKLEYV